MLTVESMRSIDSPYATDLDNLLESLRVSYLTGHVIECGVYRGRSLTAMALLHPELHFHGFDSFRGLPNDWSRSSTEQYAAGHFRLDRPPLVPPNATLHVGWFEDSLPMWKQSYGGPLRLLHIDCDIYTSTKQVLLGFNERLVPGSVITFDELVDWTNGGIFPYWPECEWKALNEWLIECGRQVRFMSRGPLFSASFVVEV